MVNHETNEASSFEGRRNKRGMGVMLTKKKGEERGFAAKRSDERQNDADYGKTNC